MKTFYQGFTLIEVLIASFIMFIALSTFTLIFRSALISSARAESTVATSAYTRLIVDRISASLKLQHKQTQANGEGTLLGRKFTWQAKVKKIGKPPARYFGRTLVQADNRIKLWLVNLSVKTHKSARQYSFEEATW